MEWSRGGTVSFPQARGNEIQKITEYAGSLFGSAESITWGFFCLFVLQNKSQ